MIDRRRVAADVHVVGNAGAGLGKELMDIITDGVMQNAAEIRDFTARKEELLRVNSELLFMLSTAMCMCFARLAKQWDAAKVTGVLEELMTEMARSFRYTSASLQLDEDAVRERQRLCLNMQKMYEHVSECFDRVFGGEFFKQDDEKATDALHTLNHYWLTQVHPEFSTLLCSLELVPVIQIQVGFGQAIWSAFRHLRWDEPPAM
jgi:hypothetical protein